MFEAFPSLRMTVGSFSVRRILIIPAFSIIPKEGSFIEGFRGIVEQRRAVGLKDGEKDGGTTEMDVEVDVQREIGIRRGPVRGRGRGCGIAGPKGGLRNSSNDTTTLSSVWPISVSAKEIT